MNPTEFFLHHELKRLDSRLDQIRRRIPQVTSMVDLGRLRHEVIAAPRTAIRALARTQPAIRNVDRLVEVRAEQLVSSAIEELKKHKEASDEDFLMASGRFIENYREACRGHFPHLYHVADQAMMEIQHWRKQNLSSDESTELRQHSRPRP